MRLLSHLKIKSKGDENIIPSQIKGKIWDEIFILSQLRFYNEMGFLSHLKIKAKNEERLLFHLDSEAKIEMRFLSHLKIRSKWDEIIISSQFRR